MCELLEVMVQVRDVGQRLFVIQGKIQVGEVIEIDRYEGAAGKGSKRDINSEEEGVYKIKYYMGGGVVIFR